MAELAGDYRVAEIEICVQMGADLAGETTMVDLNLTARNLEISCCPNNICDEKQ